MADATKTEKATPRRRQTAREHGPVVRSRELVTSLATVTTLLVLVAQAPAFAGQWRGFLRRALDTAGSSAVRPDSPLFAHTGAAVFQSTAVVLGLSCGAFIIMRRRKVTSSTSRAGSGRTRATAGFGMSRSGS